MSASHCPASTLAKLLGLTERRIQQLASEGHIIKSSRGEYDLVASIQTYIAHCQARVERGPTEKESLSSARKRLLDIQTKKAEWELAVAHDQFVSQEALQAQMLSLVDGFVQGLSALPRRLAMGLLHQSHPGVVRQKIKEECDALRNQLVKQLKIGGTHDEHVYQSQPVFATGTTFEATGEADPEYVGG